MRFLYLSRARRNYSFFIRHCNASTTRDSAKIRQNHLRPTQSSVKDSSVGLLPQHPGIKPGAHFGCGRTGKSGKSSRFKIEGILFDESYGLAFVNALMERSHVIKRIF